MRCLVGIGAAWPAVLSGATARAAPAPTARLVYENELEPRSCADEQDVRHAVALRLGRDPFAADASRTVSVRLEKRGEGFGARIELHGIDGALLGQRDLDSTDCTELVAALAFAVSLAIDPVTATHPIEAPAIASSAAQPSPPPPPPPPPAADRPLPAPAASAIAPSAIVYASLGAAGAFNAAPSPSLGLRGAIGLRWQRASLAFEMRGDLPASAAIAGGGTVSTSLLLFSVVPCARWGDFAACGIFGGGALDGSATGVLAPTSDRSAYVALGARLSFERFLFGPFGFGVDAELLAPLVQTKLDVGDTAVWTTPSSSAAFGLRGLAQFR